MGMGEAGLQRLRARRASGAPHARGPAAVAVGLDAGTGRSAAEEGAGRGLHAGGLDAAPIGRAAVVRRSALLLVHGPLTGLRRVALGANQADLGYPPAVRRF